MRGGTSKAVFLRGDALPTMPGTSGIATHPVAVRQPRSPVRSTGSVAQIYSRANWRSSTLPVEPDADLDYTFAQVSITEPRSTTTSTAATSLRPSGPMRSTRAWCRWTEPVTTVRIHNTNTGRVLLAKVPIVGGAAGVEGSYAQCMACLAQVHRSLSTSPGPPEASPESLLPTGNEMDVLQTDMGPVDATIVDLANLTVFFGAESIGMTGTEGPSQFSPRVILMRSMPSRSRGCAAA